MGFQVKHTTPRVGPCELAGRARDSDLRPSAEPTRPSLSQLCTDRRRDCAPSQPIPTATSTEPNKTAQLCGTASPGNVWRVQGSRRKGLSHPPAPRSSRLTFQEPVFFSRVTSAQSSQPTPLHLVSLLESLSPVIMSSTTPSAVL